MIFENIWNIKNATVALTSSLFTITYYFPKILVLKRKVKSEEGIVKK